MASKYRLMYFNVTGLAEPIRYLFAYGNIPYEDCRLEYDDWLKFKSKTPFGQIPVLEMNGKLYSQTSAICRHFAKQLDLCGKTDFDSFLIDSTVDTITDFRVHFAEYFKLESEVDKKEKLNEIKKIHIPYYFGKFNEIVKLGNGYFVNEKLTWADIFFAALSDLWIKVGNEPILKPYKALVELKTKVDNIPDIKAYRARRPDTLY